MKNLKHLFKRLTFGIVLTSMPLIGGCGENTLTWTEEVKLLDGRVITVTQRNRVEEDVSREFWLTFKFAEFGNQEIVWHENLLPIVLNISQNRLYVVGIPFTTREFRQYGRPNPAYLGYRYEAGQWKQLSFKEIPEAIYDVNLYFDNMALYRLKHISIADKVEMMKDESYRPPSKRIDPNHTSR